MTSLQVLQVLVSAIQSNSRKSSTKSKIDQFGGT